MARSFPGPMPLPMKQSMPIRDEPGSRVQGPAQRMLGFTFQQNGGAPADPMPPPVNPFGNMNPNPEGQRIRSATLEQNAGIPVLYEGWTFRKAQASAGEKSKWSSINRNQLAYDRVELLAIVKKMKSKMTVDKQLNSLRSPNQRRQIEQLLEEKRINEQDQNAEWILACVKDIHNRSNNGWGPDTTTELQVILRRQTKQKRVSEHKGIKKATGAVAIDIMKPPGQQIDLNAIPKPQNSAIGVKSAVEPGQTPVSCQPHSLNSVQGEFCTQRPMSAKDTYSVPQGGFPSMPGVRLSKPHQQQSQQQIFQPVPTIVPTFQQGRLAHKSNGPQTDPFDPTMPIHVVEPSEPQRPKAPIILQPKQFENIDLPFDTLPDFSRPPKHIDRAQRRLPQTTKPRAAKAVRQEPLYDFDSETNSAFSDGSRYSSDGPGSRSPMSSPTTVSAGSIYGNSRSGRTLIEDPHRRSFRTGLNKSRGPRSSTESMAYHDDLVDMMINKHGDYREGIRSPSQTPARPRYNERTLTSSEMERALYRLESIRQDEEYLIRELRRQEKKAYSKSHRRGNHTRDCGRVSYMGRHDDGRIGDFDRGLYEG